MAHKRKGQLTKAVERGKHLRKFMKRFFWKQERSEEKKEIKRDMENHL
ncbi:MAG: hypothetical protein KF803_14720 [Cyclobacteriaceae bacterium]|nr:hypothetical protein [Cyclobacteriaceae bacterium]